MSTFTPTGATGGEFEATAGSYAVGRSTVTTADASEQVSFGFTVTRRSLWFRVGTTSGDQDVINDTEFKPGQHVYSFVPGAGTYYVEFQLRDVGIATLENFARLAPDLLTLETPFAASSLRSLRSEQSLNVQWLADGVVQPRVLERQGVSSWSLRLYQPEDGPFENDDASGFTLTPDAQTGVATVTASGPVFKASDAGGLIRLTQAGQYKTETGTAVDIATDTIRVAGTGEAARTFYYSVTGTFVASVTLQRSVGSDVNWLDVLTTTGPVSTSLSDGLDGQIVYYRFKVTAYTSGSAVMALTYSGGVTYGVGRIYEVVADDEITVDVLVPFASLSATSIWAFGSWSDRLGWPNYPALFDGRLLWMRAGRYWLSKSDDYESLEVGALADDAISKTIPGRMNIPRWAKAGDRLMIGTSGGEGYISSGRDDQVLMPDNARARIRTDRGAVDADAAAVDGAPAFIHRNGRKVMLTAWDGATYNLINLTRLHRDIAGTGTLVELAFQHEPEPRLYAVRSDGQCATMLLSVAEQVGGWSRVVPAGDDAAIESVCVLPGAPEDHVYRAVRRIIDGQEVRYVEKQAAERWSDSQVAWRLDCALEYSGTATTALTGLDHLEGEEVYVWGNGRISGPHTVDGGAITTSFAVTYAIVGLKYQGFYKGPRLGALAKTKKLERLGILLHNTVGGGVSWGRDFTTMSTLPDRLMAGATYDSPLPLISEDKEFPISGSWGADQRVCVRFNGVGPATVLGLVPTVAS